jgi:hypothetical protein
MTPLYRLVGEGLLELVADHLMTKRLTRKQTRCRCV